MSVLGDLISVLSTTKPLKALATFLSPAYLTTEYNSYSITMYSDVNTNVKMQWSADAHNWDYMLSFNSAAGVASNNNFSVENKWVRVLITNTENIDATVMRFSAYASPTNATVELEVPENVILNTNVRGSFDYAENGNLMVTTDTPYNQYNFGYGTGTTAGNFEPGYRDLTFYTNKSGVTPYYFNTIQKGCLTIADAGTTGTLSTAYSNDFAAWMPNVGIEVTFSAAFSLNTTLGTGVLNIPNLLCGISSRHNGANFAQEGIFVGFIASGAYNAATALQKNIFGLFYRSDTITPVSYFIAQKDWNLDNCSGVYKMPEISNWSKFNRFKINLQQNGNVILSILNPSTGYWVPCHLLNLTNASQSSFQYPYFRFNAYQSSLASYPSYDNTGVSINDWSLSYQNNPIPKGIQHYDPITYVSSINVSTPLQPYIAYTLSNPTTWKGQPNFVNLFIDSLSTGFNATNIPAYMGIYKNVIATGGSQSYVDEATSPALINTVLPSLVDLKNTAVFSRIMQNTGVGTFSVADLAPFNIRVYPGETISIVHFCYQGGTSTNVTSSLGFYQMH